ncbi:MAG: cation transporter [Spirochaetales bacterium]|nr:cation transporter [Spirochaetales bacterium]
MKKIRAWSKKAVGYLEGFVSIIVNLVLFAGKLWVGIIFNSIAMIADAWHSLSDSFTSIVVIMGFWVSGKPADKEHPFGHGRAELIATIIIGTLLAVVGMNFFLESIQRLINYEAGQFTSITIIVCAASIISKEGLAQVSNYLGKIISSSALKADAWHHRTDAITSALIIIGALVSPCFWWIDGALGIIISIVILYAAFQILLENASIILGQRMSPKLKAEIAALVMKASDKISDIHHFHFHKYGDHSELTFHIRVVANMHVKRAHEIANTIEQKIKTEYGFETTIHIEPD